MQHENEREKQIREHPLFVPIINAMVECSVAGLKSPTMQVNPLPMRAPCSVDSSPSVDQFMFDILETTWSHKRDLENLHSSFEGLCKSAIFNLEKSTNDILANQTFDVAHLEPPVYHNAFPELQPPPPVFVSGNEPPPPMRKKTAKGLPKEARKILKDWILAHVDKPYPDEDTKMRLIRQTGLSRSQVVNWFINARRRIIKPMKEAKERELRKDRMNFIAPPYKRVCLAPFTHDGLQGQHDIVVEQGTVITGDTTSYEPSTFDYTENSY